MIHFSIHLITYNNEKHIENAIESILKQEVNFNFEVVIGDDCSTDNTVLIMEKYKTLYPNIFKIKKNESQLGILRNFKKTLDNCQGKYVFALAGDDFFNNKEALQIMFDTIDKDDSLGFIDSGYDKYYELRSKTIKFANKTNIKSTFNNYKNAILKGEIAPIGFCFNRILLLKHVDFKTYITKEISIDDYPIVVDLIMNTNFKRIDKSLVVYRIHDDSFSHKKSLEKQYFLTNQMKKLFDFFSDKYSFDKYIIEDYNKSHFKQLLFYAGFFEDKKLGKEVFLKIKSKSLKDYIHYWASQSKTFRKIVSII